MIKWLRSLFTLPEPAGPPQRIRAFTTSDEPISRDHRTIDGGGWRLDIPQSQTYRFFDVPVQGLEQCMITYRVQLKAEDLNGRAYLEMWCRLPGRGEFFSRGLRNSVSGTTSWASYEVSFYLKKGQVPDMITLNLIVEGKGTVRVKEIELLQTPLK